MLVFVSLVVTLITIIYLWVKRSYTFWTRLGIPQCEPKFPIGTLDTDRNFLYTNDEIYKKFKGKTSYVGLYFMLSPVLMIIDEEAVKNVLVRDFASVQSHGGYVNEEDDPLTAHLFSLDGKRWRDLRTKLTPTFTSGKMKMMCPIVVDIGKEFKATMDQMIDNGEKGIDMREMFARFTTDVIGTCAFGLECNSLKDPDALFRKMGRKMFEEPRHSQPMLFLIVTFPNIAKFFRVKFNLDDVEEFFVSAVNDTVEHRTKNNIKRNDFMDLMIALRNTKKSNKISDLHMEGLSMNEIATQSFLFFMGGFETSSTVSSFAIYELAKNQNVQDKLRNHIREVLKKHDGQISYEALKEMTYLDQCIKESMRMYPPLPMLTRKTTSDYLIPELGVTIPSGTMITIPKYSIHNDPKNFPNPSQYDPDRFTPEEIAKRHPFSYFPFGEGPRICIGERFGMMQARIGLINLIGNYRFKLNSKTKPLRFKHDAFVITPESKIYFDVEKV